MGPPSHNSRPQPSEGDTFSINQGDPLAPSPGPVSLPLAMMPPMTSPMPPTGTYAGGAMTPATGGKAPATATGGYLQVGGDVGELLGVGRTPRQQLRACLPARQQLHLHLPHGCWFPDLLLLPSLSPPPRPPACLPARSPALPSAGQQPAGVR